MAGLIEGGDFVDKNGVFWWSNGSQSGRWSASMLPQAPAPPRAKKTPMFKDAWVTEFWGINPGDPNSQTECWRPIAIPFPTPDDAYVLMMNRVGSTGLVSRYRVRPVTVSGDAVLAPYDPFDPSAPVAEQPEPTLYFPHVPDLSY